MGEDTTTSIPVSLHVDAQGKEGHTEILSHAISYGVAMTAECLGVATEVALTKLR